MSRPQDFIWYVRCNLAEGRILEGSAVAVKLRSRINPSATSEGSSQPKTYLLTCAHVLRQKHQDGTDGVGALVDPSWIRVWPPGVGLSEDQSCGVRIVRQIQNPDPRPVQVDDRRDLSKDWLVLEILDSTDAQRPGIWLEDWHRESLGNSEGRFRSSRAEVLGYPGGVAGLERGITQAVTSGPFFFRSETEGAVVITGSDTRPGMSGGGVFAVPYWFGSIRSLTGVPQLIGIHRARNDQTLQCRSISAKLIFDRFAESDVQWDLASRKSMPPQDDRSWVKWLASGLVLMLGLAVWIGFQHRQAQRRLSDSVRVRATLGEKELDLTQEILLGTPPLVVAEGVPEGSELQWVGTEDRRPDQKPTERFVRLDRPGEHEVIVTIISGWCRAEKRLVFRFTELPWGSADGSDDGSQP